MTYKYDPPTEKEIKERTIETLNRLIESVKNDECIVSALTIDATTIECITLGELPGGESTLTIEANFYIDKEVCGV